MVHSAGSCNAASPILLTMTCEQGGSPCVFRTYCAPVLDIVSITPPNRLIDGSTTNPLSPGGYRAERGEAACSGAGPYWLMQQVQPTPKLDSKPSPVHHRVGIVSLCYM